MLLGLLELPMRGLLVPKVFVKWRRSSAAGEETHFAFSLQKTLTCFQEWSDYTRAKIPVNLEFFELKSYQVAR